MKIIEMKHKVILLLLLTFLHFSCQNKNEIYDDELITVFDSKAKNIFLSSKKKVFPVESIVFAELFVKVKSNEFAKTSINELAYFYLEGYGNKYNSFKEFLGDILNQKIYLSKELITKFNYKTKVINLQKVKEYQDLGMDKVLEEYFVKEGKNLMLNYKLKLSREEELALQYYMFLNKRYISSDCLSGFSYCYDFNVYRKEIN